MRLARASQALELGVLTVGLLTALVVVSMLMAPVASATTSQLDQSALPIGSDRDWISSSFPEAQTFTAGVSGQLTSITLGLALERPTTTIPLTITITAVGGGVPDQAQTFGSGTIPAASLSLEPQLVTATLSAPATLVAGQSYAIMLSTTSEDRYDWYYALGANPYTRGEGEYWDEGEWNDEDADFAFATYVTPTATAQAAAGPRGAYCTAPGDTTDSGASLPAGTFVNLDDGQVYSDPHYLGATPAIFVAGKGLTCDPPPAGFTRHGFAGTDQGVDSNTYPYYSL